MQSQRQTNSGGVNPGNGEPIGPLLGQLPGQKPLSGYMPPLGAYDELLDASGAVRPQWHSFVAQLDRLGGKVFERRWLQSQRLIHENGVAYSPHRGPKERPRPWKLDPLPVLIERSEWQAIAEGLQQRGRLLELVLQDLYGPQELIRSGVLPANLLYSHPSYYLALRKNTMPAGTPTGRMLTFYSADIGRSPNGKWWVLADRTEAPSGVGFALENRIVVSRMLAEPFRDGRVERLASYFVQLRETLAQLAPQQVRNPRVAILSQGPGQPNYFEDAYLARYLGYTLVEGEDITVRNRKLWLKTLQGLAPIDVLIRRPNTENCDPLEMGGSAPSGVAGLTQSARDGLLAMANPLGSGLVESPAFLAYLPQLCQALLKEDLKLPGVATWWCGDPTSLEYVLKNLDRLILKKAFRQRGKESDFTQALRQETNDQLAARICANPSYYVAQERVQRSTAPCFSNGHIVPTHIALRTFAIADQDSFHVLEGALARTSFKTEPLVESASLSAEGSKDVWIVSKEQVEPVSLLPDDDEPIALVRIGDELPSRVAGNSYWLGRNMERVDSKARLLRTVANRLTGERDPRELPEVFPLIRALAVQGQIEPDYVVEKLRDLLPHVDQSLPNQVINRKQSGSLSANIDSVFASALKVRDRLSRDAWRVFIRLSEIFDGMESTPADLTDLINTTDEMIVDLAAVGGMVVESMTRTQFYRFLDLGRRLERAIQIVDLLGSCLVESNQYGHGMLEALLDTTDSLMTYRSRYRANLKLAAMLDLLVTDESNPRSLAFQLNTIDRHVGKLPRISEEPAETAVEQRLASTMAHTIRMTDVTSLAESHEMNDPKPLAALLDQLSKELPALSDAIAMKYLVHAGATRQLSPL